MTANFALFFALFFNCFSVNCFLFSPSSSSISSTQTVNADKQSIWVSIKTKKERRINDRLGKCCDGGFLLPMYFHVFSAASLSTEFRFFFCVDIHAHIHVFVFKRSAKCAFLSFVFCAAFECRPTYYIWLCIVDYYVTISNEWFSLLLISSFFFVGQKISTNGIYWKWMSRKRRWTMNSNISAFV